MVMVLLPLRIQADVSGLGRKVRGRGWLGSERDGRMSGASGQI